MTSPGGVTAALAVVLGGPLPAVIVAHEAVNAIIANHLADKSIEDYRHSYCDIRKYELDPQSNLQSRVRQRLDSLTKPVGSLGRLEEIALRFALIREEEMPSPARKGLYVFCGDHGIAEQGVSLYPQSVTRQMMRNFLDGGAAS